MTVEIPARRQSKDAQKIGTHLRFDLASLEPQLGRVGSLNYLRCNRQSARFELIRTSSVASSLCAKGNQRVIALRPGFLASGLTWPKIVN